MLRDSEETVERLRADLDDAHLRIEQKEDLVSMAR